MEKYGIYIHIPYCKRKCDYCNFVSFTDFSTQKRYVDRLISEIEVRANGEFCNSVYIGGGTPSVLYQDGITQIANAISKNFALSNDVEFTIEANPESCDVRFLEEIKAVGVNRISLGLQSCNDQILKRAGRLHNFDNFCSACNNARNYGIKNISADLIIGLEGDTKATFLESLQSLINISVQHISVYSLKCEEGTPLHDSGFAPDEDFLRDMYEIAVETLEANGYDRYEVSNFAKETYKSQHNLKYWTLQPYLGFGVSAHSYNNNIRRANTNSLGDYLATNDLDFRKAIVNQDPKNESLTNLYSEENVSLEEREEFLMLGLRTSDGISLDEYQKRFKTDILTTHGKKIESLAKAGYIIIEDSRLKINPSHMYVMNSIILSLI